MAKVPSLLQKEREIVAVQTDDFIEAIDSIIGSLQKFNTSNKQIPKLFQPKSQNESEFQH